MDERVIDEEETIQVTCLVREFQRQIVGHCHSRVELNINVNQVPSLIVVTVVEIDHYYYVSCKVIDHYEYRTNV